LDLKLDNFESTANALLLSPPSTCRK